MMDVEKIEDAIVERLKPLEVLPNIVVAPMPDVQDDMKKAMVDARIWVAYDGTRYEPNGSGMNLMAKAVDASIQEGVQHFKILIQARRRRGENGIYGLMEKIRTKLLGFEPCSLDPMRQIKTSFQNFEENTWTYEMMWGTAGLDIPSLEETSEPLLKELTFDDNYYTPPTT